MSTHIQAFRRRADLLHQSLRNRFPNIPIEVLPSWKSMEFRLQFPSTELSITTDQDGYTQIRQCLADIRDVKPDHLFPVLNRWNRVCKVTSFVVGDNLDCVFAQAGFLFPTHLHFASDQQFLLLLDRFLTECTMCEEDIHNIIEAEKAETMYLEMMASFSAVNETIEAALNRIAAIQLDEDEQ